MADSALDSFSAILNAARPIVTPFEEQFVYGKDRAGELALQRERNSWNGLNGSGATDPKLSLVSASAPTFSTGSVGSAKNSGIGFALPKAAQWGIIGLIGLALLLFIKKSL